MYISRGKLFLRPRRDNEQLFTAKHAPARLKF